ncbi:TetR/AcrR family transcriptional regulator [Streptomyces sp. NPDC048057]|uniref:TetR/AcrR family transcriptional regulator n=1 Tax=Streptomyces sp. NPDC048057 TaxID=3155628 RepID=UPI0033F764FD
MNSGTPPSAAPGPPEAPRRRRLTADQRRASILRAATEVFAETGYQRGRTSAVAARGGVSEPVVFHHFGSKAALYAAVLEDAVTTVGADLTRAVRDGGSVPKALAQFLDPEHVARFHRPGSLGFLFADAASLSADPDVGEAARRSLRRFADDLSRVLREGQDAGGVRPGLNADSAAWWLLSLLATRNFRALAMPDAGALEADLTAMTLSTLTPRT